MNESPSLESQDPQEEIVRLVHQLKKTQEGLQELTGGEVDSVIMSDGQSYLLYEAQEKLRKKEEELRESESRLRLSSEQLAKALYYSLDVICTFDAEGRFTQVSAACEKVWGYRPEELLGRAYLDFVLPEDHLKTIEVAAKIMGGNPQINFENRYTRKDGSLAHIMWSAAWSESDQSMFCVARDVTEEHKNRSILKLREMALSQVSQGVMICDKERLILYANKGFEKITGYSEEEVLGKNGSFLLGEKTNPQTLAELRTEVHQGHTLDIEILNYRKDGTPFWNNLSITPVCNSDGEIVHFIGIQRDITEKRRAQEAIKQQAAILDRAHDAVIVRDIDGRVTYLNESAERLYGWTIEQIGGCSASETYYKDPLEFEKATEQLLQNGKFSGEFQILTQDGRVLSTESRWTLVSDDNGQPKSVLVISRDITEKKATEESLTLATQRLRLAAEAGKIGIWERDLLSGDLIWDEQMFLLYGQQRDTYKNGVDRWSSSLHPEDRHRVVEEVQNAILPDGKPLDTEYRIIRSSDKEVRLIRAKATLLCNSEGKPVRFIGTNWDVTEERKREQALALALNQEKELLEEALAANHAKNEFLAVMSHEFRTPLNGVLGLAEILHNTPLDEEQLDYVKMIQTSGAHLLQIVSEILDFSSLEKGKLTLESKSFGTLELVQACYQTTRVLAEHKAIDFRYEITGGVPTTLTGDAQRIRQILINLLGNALKFTAEGSVIFRIAPLEASGKSFLEFNIEDSGIGIPPEKMGLLFKPFSQVDSSLARKSEGTGLGLVISMRLAEEMGGTITVESTLGKGSIFTFRLPLTLVL